MSCCHATSQIHSSLSWDFLGGLVIKISLSKAGDVGSVLGRKAKILHDLWPKNQNVKWKQYYRQIQQRLKKQSTLKKKKNTLK